MKSYNLDIIKLSKYLITLSESYNNIFYRRFTPIQLYNLLYLLQSQCLQTENKLLFNDKIYFHKGVFYIEKVYLEFNYLVGGLFLFEEDKIYSMDMPFYLKNVCGQFFSSNSYRRSHFFSEVIDYFNTFCDDYPYLIPLSFLQKIDKSGKLNNERLIEETIRKTFDMLTKGYNIKIEEILELVHKIQENMKNQKQNDIISNINIKEQEIFRFLLNYTKKIRRIL
ncbi:hypothetical protein [Fusobacterium necrophorum]|uniref:Uncharacterized protein n=2 Tax=Fusobacterium necrophorum TaxID=859 RepID=A0A162J7N6_9FUSO|nr:hypothetical protein [Fusobacterium necrophorum]KYL05287.1 hypothetical protein A2J07_00700 [Fusobacterium necrophorum subsp. funduliforme]